MEQEELIALASSLARPFVPSSECTSGMVAAVIVTIDGHLFTGVCVDTACSLGFCAEHSAVAEMLKARESAVKMIVAVNKDGVVLPPCGRCRELLWQVDDRNREAWIVIGPEEGAPLLELLPRHYQCRP